MSYYDKLDIDQVKMLIQLHKEDKIILSTDIFNFPTFDLSYEYYIYNYEKDNDITKIFDGINEAIFSNDPKIIDYGIDLYHKTKHLYDKLHIKKDHIFSDLSKSVTKFVVELIYNNTCTINDIFPFIATCDDLSDMEFLLEYAIDNCKNDFAKDIFSIIYIYQENENGIILDTEFDIFIRFIEILIKKYHNGFIELKDDYGYDLLVSLNSLSVSQGKIIFELFIKYNIKCSFDNYDLGKLHYEDNWDDEIYLTEPVKTICWLDELANTFGWSYKNMENLRRHVLYEYMNDPDIDTILIDETCVSFHTENIRRRKITEKYFDKYFG